MLRHKEKGVEKVADKTWWKLIAGGILAVGAVIFFVVYYTNPENIIMPVLFVFTALPAGYLIYTGLKKRESGFKFTDSSKRKYTGRENCINIYAAADSDTGQDIPVVVDFVYMANPPKGPKHYVRNLKRHFYENYNDTSKKKLLPVKFTDQKSYTPETANLPFTMQQVLDYYQYAPPSTLTKLAPWVIIVAMIVIGILMVITGPQPTG